MRRRWGIELSSTKRQLWLISTTTLFDFCLVKLFPRSAFYPGNRCQTSTLLQRLSSHLLDQLLVEAELSEIGLRFLVIMWCTTWPMPCWTTCSLAPPASSCWRYALTTSVTTSSPSATQWPQTLERSILGSSRLWKSEKELRDRARM